MVTRHGQEVQLVLPEQFPAEPVSVAVQSVLYGTTPTAVDRMLEALDNSAMVGKRELMCDRIVVHLGDASPYRVVTDKHLDSYRERYPFLDKLTFTDFGENTGTARGHNRLAALSDAPLIVTSNPDVIPDCRALWRMAAILTDDRVGMVEAKQLPIEHPKSYVQGTGVTGWATTAFAMFRRDRFDEVGGFDEETFFLYCDDLDFSWRLREAGYSVVYHAGAVVFHDKRLTPAGGWIPTGAERFYSAQAALLLAHKWSREDEVDRILEIFDGSEESDHERAATEFRERRDSGRLAAQRDPQHEVAQFVDGFYTEHRFAL